MPILSPSTVTRLSRLTAPSYSLTVNSLIPNPALKDRLTSLSVTLNNGVASDQLSMDFDDRPTLSGKGISIPKQGVTLDVSMGYEAYKASMGTFEVNQVSLSGSSGGRSLSVSATPALLLKEHSRTWGNKTIGDIVGSIASEYKLSAAVSPAFKLNTIDVINQLNQSDAAFLTHLAARYGAVCKPMAGKLLFMKKGEGTSASGLPMLPVPVKPHDVLQWSKQLSERQDYSKVVAHYWDPLKAEVSTVYFPAGSPGGTDLVHRLPHPYNNEAEAKQVAKAKSDELNRGDATLSLTIIGNPDITAEGKISLSDLRSDVDGDYIVKSATHSFSSGGYQTSIQAYVEPK
jgi:phage protein D